MENKEASSPAREKATRLLVPSSASTALAPNTNWPVKEKGESKDTKASVVPWDTKYRVCYVVE
jgi:hypothetical protein